MNLRKMAESVADAHTHMKSEPLRTRQDYGREEEEDEDEVQGSRMPKGMVATVASKHRDRVAYRQKKLTVESVDRAIKEMEAAMRAFDKIPDIDYVDRVALAVRPDGKRAFPKLESLMEKVGDAWWLGTLLDKIHRYLKREVRSDVLDTPPEELPTYRVR